MSYILEIGRYLLGAIKYIVPAFLVIFSILAAYSGLKWGSRLSIAIKEITSSPLKIFFWIVILITIFGIYASVSGWLNV